VLAHAPHTAVPYTDMTVSYTGHCCICIAVTHLTARFRRCESTPAYSRYITVSYTRYQGIIHQTSGYHTPDITASYTSHHCIIHQVSPHHTPDFMSYTRLHCIMHQTSLYHAPDFTVSCTRLHGIIHQTSPYHTPNFICTTSSHQTPPHHTPVSYTRRHTPPRVI